MNVRLLLLTTLLLSSIWQVRSQVNLVPNSSFETFTNCPNGASQAYEATYWDSYNGTADYFNSCSPSVSGGVSVPWNVFGNQYAYEGNGYGGFIAYFNSTFYREIIGVQLSNPLIVSQKYFITFRINRPDGNSQLGYSCNKIGARLSTIKANTVAINNTAHYYSNVIITDTINWTKLSGSFIADSAYLHLMIGNFFDDANTTLLNDDVGSIAYYYLDGVCLSTDSIFCSEYTTGITENRKKNQLKLFPSPANNSFTIQGSLGGTITVIDLFGETKRIISNAGSNGILINCSNWADGLYFVRIKNETFKLIINH